MKNEIVLFEENQIKLEVNVKDETVWLTQEQMTGLFEKNQSVISRHINNIFQENEVEEKSNMQKMHIPNSDKDVMFYSLDVIISVGYRVKSKRGIEFRKWANKVLKDHLLKGYTVNQKRLEFLEKKIQLIDIANRITDNDELKDASEILKVIGKYNKALDLLDSYDHNRISKINGNKNSNKITYDNCIELIGLLKYGEESDLFALERDKGLDSIINNIYQTFDDKDVYSSIEEKAANFLYMIIKNHVFIDGNKRIGAILFIYFLEFYNILIKNSNPVIDNNALVSIVLLIAESNPKEKEIMVDLVMNFLSE